MVHAIVNGEDPTDVALSAGGGEGRRLSNAKSNNIGKIGAMDQSSKIGELEKIKRANKELRIEMGGNVDN